MQRLTDIFHLAIRPQLVRTASKWPRLTMPARVLYRQLRKRLKTDLFNMPEIVSAGATLSEMALSPSVRDEVPERSPSHKWISNRMALTISVRTNRER